MTSPAQESRRRSHRSVTGNDMDAAIRLAQESIDRCDQNANGAPENAVDACEAAQISALLVTLGSQSKLDELLNAGQRFCLERFEVLGELGRGGFGIVLHAYDPDLQREVALKLPRPDRVLEGESPDETVREARIAAQLEHPGIVPVFETGQWGSLWYIVAAFCPGRSLGGWLRERQTALGARDAATLVRDVALALHHAHMRGVLHLDLKPDNILLKNEPASPSDLTPLVTDFGMSAWRLKQDPVGAERWGGTPDYMAPEQARGIEKEIGVATDIYALGAILAETLVGDALARSVGRSVSSAPRFSTESPVALDLRAVIEKCLSLEPSNRYASAKELAEDLQRFLDGQSVVARPVGWPISAVRWVRRNPAIAIAMLLLAATIVLGLLTATILWRRAEKNLVRYQEEANHRQLAEAGMERSVLNLAWVAQKSQLVSPGVLAESSPELQALRLFLGDMRTWQTTGGRAAKSEAGIQAAECSLALLDPVVVNDKSLQNKFRKGLLSWQRLIASEPERTDFPLALAAHIATFHVRFAPDNWLDWRQPDYGLDPSVVAQVELPYVELLIDLARERIRRHQGEPSYAMLQAALTVLASRPDHERQSDRVLASLLAVRNLSDEAARLLSRGDESDMHRVAADHIVRSLGKRKPISSSITREVAKTLARQAWELRDSGDHVLAAKRYAQAAQILREALDDPVPLVVDYLEIVRLHRRRARCWRELGQRAEADAASRDAIAELNFGIDRLPGSARKFVMVRGVVQSQLGHQILDRGDRIAAVELMEAASTDFENAKLLPSDSHGTWFAAVRTLQTLGGLHERAGRSDEALRHFKRSQRLIGELHRMTRHPRVDEYHATAVAALGRLSAAVAD